MENYLSAVPHRILSFNVTEWENRNEYDFSVYIKAMYNKML